MIHFYIRNNSGYIDIAYYRDSDLAGGSFSLPLIIHRYKKFSFTAGGIPWPEFLEKHAEWQPLVTTPAKYTPNQFIQDFPELFL